MICRVFYSWQSDLPNNSNRGFIGQALENAAKSIRNDDTIRIDPVVDRDTLGVPGAPDISHTILGKIDESDIFVCDVSIINNQQPRPAPNPNVLIELGYALKHLGSSRILLVMNTAFGGPELLPFDLRTKRVITYSMSEAAEERAGERKRLAGRLDTDLRGIVRNLEVQAALAETSLATAVTEQHAVLDQAWIAKHRSAAGLGLGKAGFVGFFEMNCGLSNPAHNIAPKTLLTASERAQVRYPGNGWPIATRSDEPGSGPRPMIDGIVSELVLHDLSWPLGPSDLYEYWALRKNGDFYLLRSLDEDLSKSNRGKVIFFDTRIQRIAEALHYSSKLYSLLDVPPTTLVEIRIKHGGLSNRGFVGSTSDITFSLVSRVMSTCGEAEQEIGVETALSGIKTNLVGIVQEFAKPLFLLFNFQEFHENIYEQYAKPVKEAA